MWASGVPLDGAMEDDDAAVAYPYLSAYRTLMQCKNLGIRIDASDVDFDFVDCMSEIQEKITEVQDKKRAANGRHKGRSKA